MERGGAGFSLPGDVKGGAVIDGGSYDGEAEGDVDPEVKGEGF